MRSPDLSRKTRCERVRGWCLKTPVLGLWLVDSVTGSREGVHRRVLHVGLPVYPAGDYDLPLSPHPWSTSVAHTYPHGPHTHSHIERTHQHDPESALRGHAHRTVPTVIFHDSLRANNGPVQRTRGKTQWAAGARRPPPAHIITTRKARSGGTRTTTVPTVIFHGVRFRANDGSVHERAGSRGGWLSAPPATRSLLLGCPRPLPSLARPAWPAHTCSLLRGTQPSSRRRLPSFLRRLRRRCWHHQPQIYPRRSRLRPFDENAGARGYRLHHGLLALLEPRRAVVH